MLLLGYSPGQVARPYVVMVLAINAAVLVLAIALMLAARLYYKGTLAALGVTGASVLPAMAVALTIMGLITAVNVLAIRRRVAALWMQ